jgi:hypothetical protein
MREEWLARPRLCRRRRTCGTPGVSLPISLTVSCSPASISPGWLISRTCIWRRSSAISLSSWTHSAASLSAGRWKRICMQNSPLQSDPDRKSGPLDIRHNGGAASYPTRKPRSCKVASPGTGLPLCYSVAFLHHCEIFYMQPPFSSGCCEVRRLFVWYLHFKEIWRGAFC